MSNYSVQVKSNRVWKVLVVDFDRICLMILEKMLQTCNYQVTTCKNAKEAILLLQNENNFDIMMIDVNIVDMDGMDFVKYICEHTHLPIIAMSSDDNEDIIKKAFKSGACEYLVKPIRVENVRHIWMNVYRTQRHGHEHSWSSSVTNIITDTNSGDYRKIIDNNKSISDGEDSKCMMKKRKLIKDNMEVNHTANDDLCPTRKKQRVIWTTELHEKFVAAVNQFGNSKAVPKKILELMDVPGLTRENVASHLQKYRQYHRQLERNTLPKNNIQLNLMSSQEKCYKAKVISTKSMQVNNEIEQMISFQHQQPHYQTISQMTQTMKFQALANESMVVVGENPSPTDMNLAIVEHNVEGSSNVIYHPFGSYATTSFIAREMSANYTCENMLDFGFNNNDASIYMEQFDHNYGYAPI